MTADQLFQWLVLGALSAQLLISSATLCVLSRINGDVMAILNATNICALRTEEIEARGRTNKSALEGPL